MKVYRKEVLVLEINQQELNVLNSVLGGRKDDESDSIYIDLPFRIEDADEE